MPTPESLSVPMTRLRFGSVGCTQIAGSSAASPPLGTGTVSASATTIPPPDAPRAPPVAPSAAIRTAVFQFVMTLELPLRDARNSMVWTLRDWLSLPNYSDYRNCQRFFNRLDATVGRIAQEAVTGQDAQAC